MIQKDRALCERYVDAYSRNGEIIQKLKENGAPDASLIYLCLSGNTLDVMSTMNARQLFLFFRLRTCSRAQWEIRRFSETLREKLIEISPEIFNLSGPSCYTDGVCPEGRLSCGNPRKRAE